MTMKPFIIDTPEDMELLEDVLQCWLLDNPKSRRQWHPAYEMLGRLKKVMAVKVEGGEE